MNKLNTFIYELCKIRNHENECYDMFSEEQKEYILETTKDDIIQILDKYDINDYKVEEFDVFDDLFNVIIEFKDKKNNNIKIDLRFINWRGMYMTESIVLFSNDKKILSANADDIIKDYEFSQYEDII